MRITVEWRSPGGMSVNAFHATETTAARLVRLQKVMVHAIKRMLGKRSYEVLSRVDR